MGPRARFRLNSSNLKVSGASSGVVEKPTVIVDKDKTPEYTEDGSSAAIELDLRKRVGFDSQASLQSLSKDSNSLKNSGISESYCSSSSNQSSEESMESHPGETHPRQSSRPYQEEEISSGESSVIQSGSKSGFSSGTGHTKSEISQSENEEDDQNMKPTFTDYCNYYINKSKNATTGQN